MKREKKMIDKRRDFVMKYVNNNSEKQMKCIVIELSEKLYLTERSISSIIREGRMIERNK